MERDNGQAKRENIRRFLFFLLLIFSRRSCFPTETKGKKRKEYENTLRKIKENKNKKIILPNPQIGHFPNAASHMNELTATNKKQLKTTFKEFNLEHFYELREHIISSLSSYWPGKNYPNMEITKVYKGDLEIYIARGRKQASFNTNQYKQWGHTFWLHPVELKKAVKNYELQY